MEKLDVILLLSGGIDSTTLLAQLRKDKKRVHALSFNYGQRNKAELEYASTNARTYGVIQHHIIQLDLNHLSDKSALLKNGPIPKKYINESLPGQPTTDYVPGRNLLMLSHAAAYGEAQKIKKIYFAANKDDARCFPDCRADFIWALANLWQSTANTKSLKLETPFLEYKKAQVVKLARQLQVDLNNTLSCYVPIGGKACGECFSCIVRKKAIEQNETV